MPTNVLKLPAYAVTALQESEHDYHVDAGVKAMPVCPHCLGIDLSGFGRREQMVHDLPSHGRRVALYIDTRRFKCNPCSIRQGKAVTFYEPLPDIDERRAMTSRLVGWIGKQATKRRSPALLRKSVLTRRRCALSSETISTHWRRRSASRCRRG